MAMIDIIILGIVAVSALIGVFRGLVKEALSLASWFAAILAGGLFSGQLADLMENLINNPALRRIAAFAILFIAVIFAGTLISNLISKLTQATGLKGVDRVLGGIFGLLRGAIIVLVIVLVATPFAGTQRWFEDSMLVPYVVSLLEHIQPYFGLGRAAAGNGGGL